MMKKPAKRAGQEHGKQYRQDGQRFQSLARFVQTMATLREALDQAAARE